MPTKTGALLAILAFVAACAAPVPSEGSGSPFMSGSIEGTVTGSEDFQVTQTIRDDSGLVSASLTYTGSCGQVLADLRLSYRLGDRVVSGASDRVFRIGPLPPNKPYSHRYQGDDTVTPDGVVFVFSNERCANSSG